MSEQPLEVLQSEAEIVTNPQHQECLARLHELETMLLTKDPQIPNHLLMIHRQLIQYEELVHLLKDEEIGILMAAQQSHTNNVLVGTAGAKVSKAKQVAASAKIQLSDL